jgi:hypothetical protein
MCYQRDIARALEDPSFRVVTFDGADQAKTRVPQDWRKNVHGDYVKHSALVQKLQTVLMHGTGIRFYVVPPFISKGMDLTVFSILDSLWDVPPSVEEVRLQFDGGSENVNFAVQTLCGLLIEYSVFKHIKANRLPVGFVHTPLFTHSLYAPQILAFQQVPNFLSLHWNNHLCTLSTLRHTHIDIDGRFALLSIHINGTKRKGSHVDNIRTPSEFDAEVIKSFKSDKATVIRFSGILDFATSVSKWLNYSNFGSTSSHSRHAIAQGGRDPQVLHMHFFKDTSGVTRMQYKYNETSSILLPPSSVGIKVFKDQFKADIESFLTVVLKPKAPNYWPEMDKVKNGILSNDELTAEHKGEWEIYFSDHVPKSSEVLTEGNCLKYMLPALVSRKKDYSLQQAPVSTAPILQQPPVTIRNAEHIHNDEVIIHDKFTRAQSKASAKQREKDHQDRLLAEKEAAVAHSIQNSQHSKRQRRVPPAEDSDGGASSSSTQTQVVKSTNPIQRGSTKPSRTVEMAFHKSVLRISENITLLPTPDGQKTDEKNGYTLKFNIGNIIEFREEEEMVHVHWYYATKMDGEWWKWVGRDNKPYKDWVHASSLITDSNDRIIRLVMEKVTRKGAPGKTRLSTESLTMMARLKPE